MPMIRRRPSSGEPRFRWYLALALALPLGPSVAQAQPAANPEAPVEPAPVEPAEDATAPTEAAAPLEPAAPAEAALDPAPAATPVAEAPPPAPVAVPAAASPPSAPASEAPADAEAAAEDEDPTHGHILDATGYLLPGRTAELGLFYMGYGITDWLNIGTQPAMWVLGPLFGGRSGNLGVKLGLPITHWVNVGLEVNATWVSFEEDEARTRGVVIPATLGASLNATPNQNYSLAARYIAAEGGNQSSIDAQEVEGAAVTRIFQLIGEARYRFTDGFALYSRGYYQAWEEDLNVDGEADIDDDTSVEVEGEAAAVGARPWAVILGTHLHWGAINLRLGVGYGNYFVPSMSFSVPNKRLFPDLNFYARF